MGILLKAKEGFEIKVKGLDFVLESIYLRTRYTRSLNGTMEVQGNIYVSEEKFQENPDLTISVVLKSELDTVPIPEIGNYGHTNVLPSNISDLEYSLNFVCEKLKEVLIPVIL